MNVDIALTIYSLYTKSLDLSTPEDVISLARNIELSDGTGSGKANRHWSDERSLGSGANETIDLTALTDAFGRTLTFTKLKVIYIKNTSSTAAIIKIGGATNHVDIFDNASDIMPIHPGGDFRWTFPTTGLTITDSDSEDLKIESSGAAGTYEIVIIGEGTVA